MHHILLVHFIGRQAALIIATGVGWVKRIEVIARSRHIGTTEATSVLIDGSTSHIIAHQGTDVTTLPHTKGYLEEILVVLVVVEMANGLPDVTIVWVQLVGIAGVAYHLGTSIFSYLIELLPVLGPSDIIAIGLSHSVIARALPFLHIRSIEGIAVPYRPATCMQGYPCEKTISIALGNALAIIVSILAHPGEKVYSLLQILNQVCIDKITVYLLHIDIREV